VATTLESRARDCKHSAPQRIKPIVRVTWLAHPHRYGYYVIMKTTVDLSDALLLRAKRFAAASGKPLRALIEEGLRRVLEEDESSAPYRLPDRSVGEAGGENPLESLTWQDLREEIYGNGGQ
jgi:hypothetical protein